ncbi:TPA: EAL domain-containing protein [Stenotrophomonas maltophilia]|nr:EAL domain-containing protein [Stenotrophomonas maltophilia]HDS1025703.1 EAL domain-containing protein [Stenotrophomonas maltophilia]HDS1029797.1 EAL domain-containing protein [Stenotrophomonas maltophilia]HDS1033739.1 EAL domain-containing protein [Stenotrophomonas maltophilia]HDS1038232.1 EAL domain-containing protein [Stenotrophomonas maltophilia]
MAANESPAGARPGRAETPPADHWQRWASVPTAAAMSAAAAPADPAAGLQAPPPLPPTSSATPAPVEAGNSSEPPPAADSPYRVLIVEDDRAQALFAQSVLHGAGMQAVVLSDADGVQQAIRDQHPDLILMDLHLPGLDGMRLTAMIRQQPGMQLLPIVFLSGDPDPERQFEVLDSGADDYLSKPIRPRHLIAAVANRIRRARAQAATLPGASGAPATSNPETGLPTRHHVLQQLNTALAHRDRGGVFFVEISSALGLRERYGYAAFERLMVQAGQRLAEAGHPHLLARLNDNSFLLLARDADEDSLDAIAAALREQLSARAFVIRDDESVHLRGVVGYAPLSPGFDDATSALEAIERTTLQARLLSAGVAGHVHRQAVTGQEHLALLEGQLELAYQPIVAVAGGGSAQYQLLLRLRQADGTVLTAGQVIPAAEAAGRIADLDQQVLEHAMGLLDLYRHATQPLNLFVSQSLRTLQRDAFADWLLESLQQRDLPGSALVIDVRLPDALIHTVPLQQFCQRMASVGVRFCLSQFEPGGEADALLTQLPLSFVRMAARFSSSHTNPETREELRRAIEQAHAAGLQIIGQQIEDPQAAAAMWVGGVDYIQGNMVQSAGSDLNFDFHNAVL